MFIFFFVYTYRPISNYFVNFILQLILSSYIYFLLNIIQSHKIYVLDKIEDREYILGYGNKGCLSLVVKIEVL